MPSAASNAVVAVGYPTPNGPPVDSINAADLEPPLIRDDRPAAGPPVGDGEPPDPRLVPIPPAVLAAPAPREVAHAPAGPAERPPRELFKQAMDIWVSEMPDIYVGQLIIRYPMNTTNWTNWPTQDNVYGFPHSWQHDFMLTFINLKPAQ